MHLPHLLGPHPFWGISFQLQIIRSRPLARNPLRLRLRGPIHHLLTEVGGLSHTVRFVHLMLGVVNRLLLLLLLCMRGNVLLVKLDIGDERHTLMFALCWMGSIIGIRSIIWVAVSAIVTLLALFLPKRSRHTDMALPNSNNLSGEGCRGRGTCYNQIVALFSKGSRLF